MILVSAVDGFQQSSRLLGATGCGLRATRPVGVWRHAPASPDYS